MEERNVEATAEQLAEGEKLNTLLSAFEKIKLFQKAIAEIQNKRESDKTLDDALKIQNYMHAIDTIWKKMPRTERRKIMNPKFKQSRLIIKALKQK